MDNPFFGARGRFAWQNIRVPLAIAQNINNAREIYDAAVAANTAFQHFQENFNSGKRVQIRKALRGAAENPDVDPAFLTPDRPATRPKAQKVSPEGVPKFPRTSYVIFRRKWPRKFTVGRRRKRVWRA